MPANGQKFLQALITLTGLNLLIVLSSAVYAGKTLETVEGHTKKIEALEVLKDKNLEEISTMKANLSHIKDSLEEIKDILRKK